MEKKEDRLRLCLVCAATLRGLLRLDGGVGGTERCSRASISRCCSRCASILASETSCTTPSRASMQSWES